ncbi:nuclear transport factor 2 family protein [Microbacterium algeriense]|uniref:nuclear transport factor 2 family protein n=1 Tax=Microbacterium algeriense TaxID=2615184 RepID=UPI0029B8A666|nr:nuclear transport factor 2 family protein [Microbacterium algeriense]MDX2398888.1 nuclear transport factor 2 family protein [Microbacterium algeriense]
MDDVHREALGGIQQLERELIVSDFVSLLNDGAHRELYPFLTDDVLYRPSPARIIEGRSAVTRMLADMHASFDEWSTTMVSVAVRGDTVLTEQRLRLRLAGSAAVEVMGFSSFRLQGFQICAWHQVHA